jgi:hypothetical protein
LTDFFLPFFPIVLIFLLGSSNLVYMLSTADWSGELWVQSFLAYSELREFEAWVLSICSYSVLGFVWVANRSGKNVLGSLMGRVLLWEESGEGNPRKELEENERQMILTRMYLIF